MRDKKKRQFEYVQRPGIYQQVFALFRQRVLGISVEKPQSVEEVCYARNLRIMRLAAVVVILTNLYWLVDEYVNGSRFDLFSPLPLISISVHVLLSVYMVVLSYARIRSNTALVRYSFLFYYLYTISASTVLAVVKNMRVAELGVPADYVGISLSAYYLVLLALAPMPARSDSILLGIALCGTFALPLFLPGAEGYAVNQQLILRFSIVVAYLFFAGTNERLSMRDLEVERLNEIMTVASFSDSLTGTLNRRALDEYWNYVCNQEEVTSVGVLMLDVDDFKKYNDCYTHVEGDRILQEVSRVVIDALKEEQIFFFRYGGEEFVVFLLNPTDKDILAYADMIRRAVWDANIPRDDGTAFSRITVTIGCARESAKFSRSADYILKADEQLYLGKSCGKNCIMYADTKYE